MNNPNPNLKTFKLAMLPSLLLGIVTNLYILTIVILVNAPEVMFSPIIGVVIFIVCFYLLRRDYISGKTSFLIAASAVAIEVCIHTHYLGWDSGFAYFMFLLPIVFLLNPTWKYWMMILFNGTIFLITVMLWWFYHDISPIHFIETATSNSIGLLNGVGTSTIVIVIVVYFSRSLHKKDEALIEANIELEMRNLEISKQHKSLQILVKEIHHRVKNNLQIISSLMSLQSRKVEDKETSMVLNESKRRIEAIAMIHQKLSRDDKANRVDFKAYLDDLIDSQNKANPSLVCVVKSPSVMLNLDVAVPLGLIISELVVNSIKHAFADVTSPRLDIELKKVSDRFELSIRDNGAGLPVDFDIKASESLGMEIIAALIDQISAEIEFLNDEGATCKIRFVDLP